MAAGKKLSEIGSGFLSRSGIATVGIRFGSAFTSYVFSIDLHSH